MTNAELIVLGMLAEGDSYGYQIETRIKERNIRKWADIGFSSIYYVLDKLEKHGMVISVQQESAQGPSRRIFTITENGRQRLIEETLSSLSRQIPLPSSFYVALALLRHVDTDDAIKALSVHNESVSDRLKQLDESFRQDQPELINAMFDLGRWLAQTEKSWLEQFCSRLRRSQNREQFYGL